MATPWSENGQQKTPNDLKEHLKWILTEERKRTVPGKPPARLPLRKELPTLGTLAPDVASIDDLHAREASSFEDRARALRSEREAAGVGDRYTGMQPASQPSVDRNLVGQQIENCFSYDLNDGGTSLLWRQGVVLEVSDGTNMMRGPRSKFKKGEAVRVQWDANEEVGEDVNESVESLLPSRWNPRNKHTEGSWRLDMENKNSTSN